MIRHLARSLRAAVLPLASAAAMGVVLLTSAWDWEEGAGLRLLYALRGIRPPPDRVMIIALDATSAGALGQSERPERWARSLHAVLVGLLAERGAAVVGFDVLFERSREPAEDDQALAAAFRRAGNVMLVEQLTRETISAPDGTALGSVDRRVRALPLFLDAVAGSGPFVLPKTPEGVFEFWDSLPSAGDQPSLPVLMAERIGAAPSPAARRRVLNLYGPLGSVRTVSYARALALAADPQEGAVAFAGKAVLVGFAESNQSRQADAYRTPFTREDGVDLPGVELLATALGNLLDGSGLTRPEDAATVPPLLAWAALLSLPWLGLGTRRAALVTAILGGVAVAGSAWAFAVLDLWLPVILAGLVAPAVAALLGIAWHIRAARRRERQLRRAVDLGLTHKGSEALASLLRGREAGRRFHGVCLCSDIEGYTALAENLSPEATRDILNRYFAAFIPVVQAHGGHVMDIVGDAVLSLWLADDAPDEACARARAAVLELHTLMNRAPAEGTLPTRFGLHVVQVFLGELGATHHREIRAVGNIVNTASRIQSANKHLGTRILASAEVTAHGGPGSARPLGRFVLAGQSAPVGLHELRCEALPADADRAFADGLAAWSGGAADWARERFAATLTLVPGDGPARFYAARCRERGALGADPDGIVVLGSK